MAISSGGIDNNELLEEAMYRELYEEVGLKRFDVSIIGKTKHAIKYDIPPSIRSKGIGGKVQRTITNMVLIESERR